jgi:hypothetical protein
MKIVTCKTFSYIKQKSIVPIMIFLCGMTITTPRHRKIGMNQAKNDFPKISHQEVAQHLNRMV